MVRPPPNRSRYALAEMMSPFLVTVGISDYNILLDNPWVIWTQLLNHYFFWMSSEPNPRQAQALSVESNNYHQSMWDSRKSSQPDLPFNSFNSMLLFWFLSCSTNSNYLFSSCSKNSICFQCVCHGVWFGTAPLKKTFAPFALLIDSRFSQVFPSFS